jgi:hypothetical protein
VVGHVGELAPNFTSDLRVHWQRCVRFLLVHGVKTSWHPSALRSGHRLGLMHRLSLLALVLLLKGVAEYHSDNQDGCQQLEFAEGRGDCRGE